MVKHKNRIAVLLAVLMLFGAIPAFAAERMVPGDDAYAPEEFALDFEDEDLYTHAHGDSMKTS